MANKTVQLMNSAGTDNLYPVVPFGIDTSNLLATFNQSTALDYTATEDCYVVDTSTFVFYDTNTWSPTIDGVYVPYNRSVSYQQQSNSTPARVFPLRKGSTYHVHGESNKNAYVKVWGVKK